MQTTNNQAVKTETPSVELKDGRKADLLVANLNKKDQKLTVITADILKFLIGLLPKADMKKIIRAFSDKLRAASAWDAEAPTMEQYVAMLQEELEFHLSVNTIQEYFTVEEVQEVKEQPAAPEVVAE